MPVSKCVGVSHLVGVFVVRRHVRLGRSASETRSPAADTATDRRLLRRHRRRSQFATAAAAALQAAVSRAAAATTARPRFLASPRGGGLTPPLVRPIVIKPEHETEPLQGERDDETSDVELQAMICDQRTEPGRQQTSSTAGSRHDDTRSLSKQSPPSNLIKPPLATARAASCDGRVHMFVCLFICLSPNCKKAIFSKTKQFRAMVSTDDL